MVDIRSDGVGAAAALIAKRVPEPVTMVGGTARPEPVAGIASAALKALASVHSFFSNLGWGVHAIPEDLPFDDFREAHGVGSAETSMNSVTAAPIVDRAVRPYDRFPKRDRCQRRDRCPRLPVAERREDRLGDLTVRARRPRGWMPKQSGLLLQVDLEEGLLRSPTIDIRPDLDPRVGIVWGDRPALESGTIGARSLPDDLASPVTRGCRHQM
ncbi:MAG: hypothetical protein JWO62_2032 [Acidimicrobiaceae bacterium]|nr:hypothetical protein [Acidimicrobiaceae bacterium]